jgi:hypothetical protein
MSTALVIVTVILVVTPGASAESKYKVLHKFTGGADGNGPGAALIFDQRGNLYGTTEAGGAGAGCTENPHCGTVFKLAPDSHGGWSETALYSFCSLTNCADGAAPLAGLIFDRAGNLYGTTNLGGSGAFGFGIVFELMPTADGSWKEKVLHQFTGGKDGGAPGAGVIFDQLGNLYGTAFQGGNLSQCAGIGCGLVFELTPKADGSWTESVLYRFTGSPDGSNPSASLIFDTAGNLYGTTYYGGASSNICVLGVGGCGTVFKLTPGADHTWTETVLQSFNLAQGAYPQANLIFDQAGNLYSTTQQGGNLSQCSTYPGCGLVFQLTPESDGSWTENVLYSFDGLEDGGLPVAGVISDPLGNLYGTTMSGGDLSECTVNQPPSGCGVAFKLEPNSKGGWKETVLHRFYDSPGAHPFAGLLLDTAGNLYGTTLGDLTTTFGAVFEIAPSQR